MAAMMAALMVAQMAANSVFGWVAAKVETRVLLSDDQLAVRMAVC